MPDPPLESGSDAKAKIEPKIEAKAKAGADTGIGALDSLKRAIASLSPLKAALLIGLLSFCLNFLLGSCYGRVAPKVHDEFSYLLAAETFSLGQLSAPTHPMWVHFESFHTGQTPTRFSKYPPGHALVLAIGAKLGDVHLGLWLEGALAGVAFYYFLRACFSPGWAFLGALVGIFNPLLLMWNHMFWGGALHAAGGAVVLGAAVRAGKAALPRHGAVFGLGVSVLMLTRPFEGAIFTIFASAILAGALLRRGGFSGLAAAMVKLAPGFLLVWGAAVGWMGYYNYRVTGSAFVMPYMVYEKLYAPCPFFLWQDLGPMPEYRHAPFVAFAEGERAAFLVQKTLPGLAAKLRGLFFENIGYSALLLTPFVLALFFKPRRRTVIAVSFLALFLATEFLSVAWFFPHYVAAILALYLYIVIVAFQELAMRIPRLRLLWLAALAFAMGGFVLHQATSLKRQNRPRNWAVARQNMIRELEQKPGKHLVLVSYGKDASPHKEWVYNSADIDNTRVVFARSMVDNARLLDYFKDRTIWRLNVISTKERILSPFQP